MRLQSFAVALLIAVVPAQAHGQGAALPLKRVRMYETGVGYFERTGTVQSAGDGVSLPVPSGHLDDALKTLVVLSSDPDAGVSGIEFASSVSQNMARALAGLPMAGEAAVDYEKLLDSMKGAHVELRSGGASFQGRLVDVIAPPEDGHRDCE
jgi:hypothetical protein